MPVQVLLSILKEFNTLFTPGIRSLAKAKTNKQTNKQTSKQKRRKQSEF